MSLISEGTGKVREEEIEKVRELVGRFAAETALCTGSRSLLLEQPANGGTRRNSKRMSGIRKRVVIVMVQILLPLSWDLGCHTKIEAKYSQKLVEYASILSLFMNPLTWIYL